MYEKTYLPVTIHPIIINEIVKKITEYSNTNYPPLDGAVGAVFAYRKKNII
jgi:hypothetical protein